MTQYPRSVWPTRKNALRPKIPRLYRTVIFMCYLKDITVFYELAICFAWRNPYFRSLGLPLKKKDTCIIRTRYIYLTAYVLCCCELGYKKSTPYYKFSKIYKSLTKYASNFFESQVSQSKAKSYNPNYKTTIQLSPDRRNHRYEQRKEYRD